MKIAQVVILFSLSVSTMVLAQTSPVPLINNPLVPTSATPGGGAFTLTVNGTGFVSGSVVNWNGSPLETIFVGNSQLTATVPSTNTAVGATATVTVINPAPGGGSSNGVLFPIAVPASLFSFFLSQDIPLSFGIEQLVSGDMDGDGKPDLAITHFLSNADFVMLGSGHGTFRRPIGYATGSGADNQTTGDFNGDGRLDFAVVDYNANTISILLGNGDGTFQSKLDYPSGTHPYEIATADLNGDGKLDLVTVTSAGTTISVLLGNGDGSFQQPVEYQTGGQPFFMVVGDFNQDNRLDVAVTNTFTSQVSILLGNGDGSFQSPRLFAAPTNPNVLVAADLNGDGKLDLAVNPGYDDSVAVFLGNGDGTLQAFKSYSTGFFPSTLIGSVADFNGDGKLDLIFEGSGVLSVLPGKGNGTFGAPILVTEPDPSAFGLIVGDFNDDGRLDFGAVNDTDVLLLTQSTVTLSKADITFGERVLGTSSSPRRASLTNIGNAVITIHSIQITGVNSASFAQKNNCGKSLAVGASCTISVRFTPGSEDQQTALVSIADSAPGSPQTIMLSGIGTYVKLIPRRLDFGSVPVGMTSAPQAVILTNTGDTALNLAGIDMGGQDRRDFASTDNCGTTIPPHANCTITVTFTPLVAGTRRAVLTIHDDGGGSPQKVSLTGTGT